MHKARPITMTAIVAATLTIITAMPLSSFGENPISVQGSGVVATPTDSSLYSTIGHPSYKAYATVNGNFEAYWEKAKSSYEGKAFEYLYTVQENSRFKALGDNRNLRVTAAEGNPHAAADLLLVDKSGNILEKIQCKLGWKNLLNAADDPKYQGMKLLTDYDSLTILERELAKAKVDSARRGIELPAKWEQIDDALRSGRILRQGHTGTPLLARQGIRTFARHEVYKMWSQTGKMVPAIKESARAASATVDDITTYVKGSAKFLKMAPKIARVASKGAIPVAVVLEGYCLYDNLKTIEKQYQNGELTLMGREEANTKNIAGAAGGVVGAIYGAKLGAMGGLAIGSVFPGPGNAIGAAIGGVIGGVGGYIGGEIVLESAAEWAIKKLHSTGTTIASATSTVWDGTKYTATAAWKACTDSTEVACNGIKDATKATGNGCGKAWDWTSNKACLVWNWATCDR